MYTVLNYIGPFESNHKADVAPSENESDTRVNWFPSVSSPSPSTFQSCSILFYEECTLAFLVLVSLYVLFHLLILFSPPLSGPHTHARSPWIQSVWDLISVVTNLGYISP